MEEVEMTKLSRSAASFGTISLGIVFAGKTDIVHVRDVVFAFYLVFFELLHYF